jgi:hypothetical protein
MTVTINSGKKQSLLGRATAFFVYLFEKVMPDPFVFAVILTFVGALLALQFAPNATLPSVASAWYGGIFVIFAFAFQMVLMLVAGYALAIAPPVQRSLDTPSGYITHDCCQHDRLMDQLGTWPGHGCSAGARDGKAG